jgi:sec-independent protein translocase protein TatA
MFSASLISGLVAGLASNISPLFAFLPNLGPMEMIIILVICILLFGRRLPEVGRSLGKGIVEFKKGLRGIEEEVDQASNETTPPPRGSHRIDADSPKFEIPDSPSTQKTNQPH